MMDNDFVSAPGFGFGRGRVFLSRNPCAHWAHPLKLISAHLRPLAAQVSHLRECEWGWIYGLVGRSSRQALTALVPPDCQREKWSCVFSYRAYESNLSLKDMEFASVGRM